MKNRQEKKSGRRALHFRNTFLKKKYNIYFQINCVFFFLLLLGCLYKQKMSLAERTPSFMYIRQPSLYGDIKKQIALFWGIHHKLTHNPAPNPVSLTREHLSLLQNESYVVAEKSDGVRYLLLISKFSDGQRPFAVMIDRAFKMYQIEIFAPHYVYRGSLFDGELVWDKKTNCLKFLIFDVVAYAGKSVCHHYFLQRYEIINQAFLSQEEWSKDQINDYSVACETASAFAEEKKIVAIPQANKLLFLYSKPVVLFNLFGSLTRSTKTLTHETDGFLFTPVKCKVLHDTHSTMFKWKFEPSIDFQVEQDQGGLYRFSCADGKNIIELKHAFQQWNFIFESVHGFVFQKKQTFIIETLVKEKQGKSNEFICTFHRFRPDKTRPNNKQTVEKIIKEIREGIVLEELISISETSRSV
jgi:hypothetical protein